SRWSPVPPVQSCLLLPAPSCNRISGEDLRQRGSSRASFRACASSTYSTLGGTPFWSSLHLSEGNASRSESVSQSKDPCNVGSSCSVLGSPSHKPEARNCAARAPRLTRRFAGSRRQIGKGTRSV